MKSDQLLDAMEFLDEDIVDAAAKKWWEKPLEVYVGWKSPAPIQYAPVPKSLVRTVFTLLLAVLLLLGVVFLAMGGHVTRNGKAIYLPFLEPNNRGVGSLTWGESYDHAAQTPGLQLLPPEDGSYALLEPDMDYQGYNGDLYYRFADGVFTSACYVFYDAASPDSAAALYGRLYDTIWDLYGQPDRAGDLSGVLSPGGGECRSVWYSGKNKIVLSVSRQGAVTVEISREPS